MKSYYIPTGKRVFVDERLALCPNGQCGVRYWNDRNELISYNTVVIRVFHDGWLQVSGLYSATTRRHIGYFLRQFMPQITFQQIKEMCLGNYDYNVVTGEIRERDFYGVRAIL